MKARINGIEIGYDVTGEGPWLVLCNSLGMNRSMWFQQVQEFSRSHRVLTWDTRGHGESTTAPGPYDFHVLAEDLAGLLDTLDISRTALLGLSMGGGIVQIFAARHPDRVSAAVIAGSSAWFGRAGDEWKQRIAAVRQGGLASLRQAQAQRWFTDSFQTAHPEIADRILGILTSTDQSGYVATQEGLACLDVRPLLGDIRCPTLVIVGSEDPATPPSEAEVIQGGIQGARLVVLDGLRHLAPVEAPSTFNPIVLEFLEQVGA